VLRRANALYKTFLLAHIRIVSKAGVSGIVFVTFEFGIIFLSATKVYADRVCATSWVPSFVYSLGCGAFDKETCTDDAKGVVFMQIQISMTRSAWPIWRRACPESRALMNLILRRFARILRGGRLRRLLWPLQVYPCAVSQILRGVASFYLAEFSTRVGTGKRIVIIKPFCWHTSASLCCGDRVRDWRVWNCFPVHH